MSLKHIVAVVCDKCGKVKPHDSREKWARGRDEKGWRVDYCRDCSRKLGAPKLAASDGR